MNNGAVITEVGSQTEELATRMLDQVYNLLKAHGIVPNTIQEQMLTSHVRAMAHEVELPASRCPKWKPACLKKFQLIQ